MKTLSERILQASNLAFVEVLGFKCDKNITVIQCKRDLDDFFDVIIGTESTVETIVEEMKK